MNKSSYLACLLGFAAGVALLLQACDSSPVDNQLPTGDGGPVSVTATLVSSPTAVTTGPPGAYYISEDRLRFHLRCPCGRCSKFNALPLEPSPGSNVWRLSGEPGKPSLSPSIHWFETDGVTTHWHGWLRDGVFAN